MILALSAAGLLVSYFLFREIEKSPENPMPALMPTVAPQMPANKSNLEFTETNSTNSTN